MSGMIALLRKLRRTSGAQRRLLLEALVCLTAARAALALLPFKRLIPIFSWTMAGPEVCGAARERLRREVAWAIRATSAHLPIEMVCFPRGIAAQIMLRRRCVGTTLYYGVANLPGQGLTAHVWVQDGAVGVMGHASAPDYTVMMRYPETHGEGKSILDFP